ncbi:MAG: nucleotide synthetase [Phenylobacterium sp.]
MGEQLTISGVPIPETTDIRWEGPKPIRHFVFALRQASNRRIEQMNLPQHSLVLFREEQTPNPATRATTVEEAAAYAAALATAQKDYPRKDAGPIDLPITDQCWVVLELEKDINWRFSSTQPAVTTKAAETPLDHDGVEKSGLNANLRYAYPNGDVVADPEKGPAGFNCRVVFFRVVGRAKDERQAMNFVVELYTVVEKGVAGKVIPLIIDPDVPNDGTTGFPSPP